MMVFRDMFTGIWQVLLYRLTFTNNKKSPMKKVNVFAALFFAAVASIFATSCGGAAVDPVAYNNQLVTFLNENDKDVNTMNTAMGTQDYEKAEAARKVWEENLGKSIAAAQKMDTWKDDAGLKAAVVEGLEGYKKLAADDYKKLITLRTQAKNGDAAAEPQISTVLNGINDQFTSIAGKINVASNAFEAKQRAGK